MYEIPPGMTYSGKWHTEGHTENIVAAGVYYVEASPHLIGGNLIFRPRGMNIFSIAELPA